MRRKQRVHCSRLQESWDEEGGGCARGAIGVGDHSLRERICGLGRIYDCKTAMRKRIGQQQSVKPTSAFCMPPVGSCGSTKPTSLRPPFITRISGEWIRGCCLMKICGEKKNQVHGLRCEALIDEYCGE